MEVGDSVRYFDQYGKEHNALVTAVWNGASYGSSEPGLNLVLVSDNDAETDQYGRQISRQTSVIHAVSQPAHGRYWMREGEKKAA